MDFADPVIDNIKEIAVSAPNSAKFAHLDDLSGQLGQLTGKRKAGQRDLALGITYLSITPF